MICAGGWLPDLLGTLPLPSGFLAGFPPLQVREENVFHFPYRDKHPHGSWPTIMPFSSSAPVM